MTAFRNRLRCFAFLTWLAAFAPLGAGPVSSAPFREALETAECIADRNPDWSIYRAFGDSMGDYYGSDSLLLVKRARLREIREGMMVVYRTKAGELIAHKVVEHHGSWLRTKGVRNQRADPVYVRSDMIVGLVFGVVHSSALPRHSLVDSQGRPLPRAHCREY